MLKLVNITKDYVTKGVPTVHALKGLTINFRRNEFVAILGASGCGKTTLLNIIGNNNEIQEVTFFASDKTTPEVDFPTVTRLHYVNGKLNPANSYLYGNDANLSFDKLDQKTIDKFSKNANGRILQMKKILQALKK